MRYEEIYIDDEQVKFRLDCEEDIATASDVKVLAFHSSISEPQELAFDGIEDGHIVLSHRSAGDMNALGLWRIQPRVTIPSDPVGRYRGRPLIVLVREEGTP